MRDEVPGSRLGCVRGAGDRQWSLWCHNSATVGLQHAAAARRERAEMAAALARAAGAGGASAGSPAALAARLGAQAAAATAALAGERAARAAADSRAAAAEAREGALGEARPGTARGFCVWTARARRDACWACPARVCTGMAHRLERWCGRVAAMRPARAHAPRPLRMPGARRGRRAAEMRACQRARRSRPARRGGLT